MMVLIGKWKSILSPLINNRFRFLKNKNSIKIDPGNIKDDIEKVWLKRSILLL